MIKNKFLLNGPSVPSPTKSELLSKSRKCSSPGLLCEMLTDPCQIASPCMNGGTCVPDLRYGSFTCVCPVEFSGPLCQIPNPCQPNPCLNGALCFEAGQDALCVCQDGYDGYLCEIDIDECQSDPCQNGGTCVDRVDSYVCRCLPGFSGKAGDA